MDLYKSSDGGKHWVESDSGLIIDTFINSLAIVDSHTYLAGVSRGMFKSVDGGKNWFQINSGLPFLDKTS